MRFRISPGAVLAVAFTVTLVLSAPAAMPDCPPNGGTLCTAPGDQGHLTGAGWSEPIPTCPSCPDAGIRSRAAFVWEDPRDQALNGLDLYVDVRVAPCFD